MNTYQAYKTLTPEQQRLLKEKQIEGDRTLAEWMQLLAPLAAFDRSSDSTRKRGVFLIVIGIISLFAAIFLSIAVSPILGALAVIVGVILLIAGITIYRKTSSLDLANNLREFVLPLLAILREDARPDQPIHLRMDLRGSTIKEKQTRESAPYSSGIYHKVVDSFYLDPWFDGQASFVDGSRVEWKLIDHIRKTEKTKRNPRGKYKTKTKHKQKSHIRVMVSLPEKSYDVRAGQANGTDKMSVTPGEKRTTVKLHRVVQTDSLTTLDPHAFVDVVATAFKQATPVQG